METNLIKDIKKISNNLDHRFHFLAKFIINNLTKIPNLKISELAKQTFSSVATINRFIKLLNLSGYKEFIHLIAYYNHMADKIYDETIPVSLLHNEVLNNVYKNTISTIQKTYKLISLQMDNINIIIDMLLESKKIYIFAIGGTYNVAKDFSEKLLRIGFAIISASDFHSSYFLVNQATNNDLVLIISYSGETLDLIKIAEICEYKKIRVVSLTKNNKNSLLKFAFKHVVISSDQVDNRLVSTTSRLALLFMLDVLYLTLIERNYEEYHQVLYNTTLTKI